MAGTGRHRGAAASDTAACPSVASTGEPGAGARKGRLTAGLRARRLLIAAGLLAGGWILGILFVLLCSTPAAAASYGAAEHPVHAGAAVSQPFTGEDAEAMAGRGVDGLTSQSGPSRQAPSTADHHGGSMGFVPQSGGGAGPFGAGFGEVARSDHDPRTAVFPAPATVVSPPVVRTAADDPSFSPD